LFSDTVTGADLGWKQCGWGGRKLGGCRL